MKTCGFENQINPYLDGELSGAKLRSFEAHLQECRQCREEVEQYRGMLEELHGLKDREVPPELQNRLHAALSEELSKGAGTVKRKFNPWALTAVAAALVLVFAGGAMLSGGFTTGNNLIAAPTMAPNADMAQNFGASRAGGVEESQSRYDAAAMPEATAAATMAPAAEAPEPERNAIDKGGMTTQGLADGKSPALQAEDNMTKAAEGRKIIYTANLVVETRDYDGRLATVLGLCAKYGGYKASSQEYGVPDANGQAGARSAVFSLRIPLDKYDDAMADLKAMGTEVISNSETTEDVSRQYVDTEARNKTLKAERDKLYELLAKADTMESIIALQDRITELTTEIEQMTAQLNYWDDQVSYSTITVELRELVTPKTVKPVDPDLNERMDGALNTTLNNMKTGLENFSVKFVGFLPWLAIILLVAAVLAAILVPVARKARRAAKKEEANHKEES